MESEEKKLISEQTQTMKDLITELRNTYSALSVILPEIENTETAKRIKAEREAFVKRNL
tara:strand:- start:373 stop:549 length:177 start_codon:yes stop_codon:yes gene_type:complete